MQTHEFATLYRALSKKKRKKRKKKPKSEGEHKNINFIQMTV